MRGWSWGHRGLGGTWQDCVCGDEGLELGLSWVGWGSWQRGQANLFGNEGWGIASIVKELSEVGGGGDQVAADLLTGWSKRKGWSVCLLDGSWRLMSWCGGHQDSSAQHLETWLGRRRRCGKWIGEDSGCWDVQGAGWENWDHEAKGGNAFYI